MWINRFITEQEFRRHVICYVLFIGISPSLLSTQICVYIIVNIFYILIFVHMHIHLGENKCVQLVFKTLVMHSL